MANDHYGHRYGVVLRGMASRTDFIRVLVLHKRAIRIIASVNIRASCRSFSKYFQVLHLVFFMYLYMRIKTF